jgi:hypothetical protein
LIDERGVVGTGELDGEFAELGVHSLADGLSERVDLGLRLGRQ